MDLAAWEEQYRKEADSATARELACNPLLVQAALNLRPGRALDLACGAGGNTLWLAQRGWNVTAVDGSATAIDVLTGHAQRSGVTVDAQVADLENPGFTIAPDRYNLIAKCYYFQRNLIQQCKRGVVPGGVMVVIALLIEQGKEDSTFRLLPGELRDYFADWEILHDHEGADAWQHNVAELVARRPATHFL
jgi:tellurite methyltransferase